MQTGDIVFQLTFIYHPDRTEEAAGEELLAGGPEAPAESGADEPAAVAIEPADEVPLEEAEARTIRPVPVDPDPDPGTGAVAGTPPAGPEAAATAEQPGTGDGAQADDAAQAPKPAPELAGETTRPTRRSLPGGRGGKKTKRDRP